MLTVFDYTSKHQFRTTNRQNEARREREILDTTTAVSEMGVDPPETQDDLAPPMVIMLDSDS